MAGVAVEREVRVDLQRYGPAVGNLRDDAGRQDHVVDQARHVDAHDIARAFEHGAEDTREH